MSSETAFLPERALDVTSGPARRRSGLSTVGRWVAVAVLAATFASALLPGLLSPDDPLIGNPAEALFGPSTAHPFGTDYLGRDLLSRVVSGTRNTVLAAVVAVLVGLVTGGLAGVVAGLVGGRVDQVVMRVVDVLLAVPHFLLSLCLIAVLGTGLLPIAIAVGIGSIATFSRLARVTTQEIVGAAYLESARGYAAGTPRIVRVHVLPHIGPGISAIAILELGQAILSIAALGFLGYGVQPPEPEWGLILAEGRNYLATAWWITTLPGLVIVAFVLSTARLNTAVVRREFQR